MKFLPIVYEEVASTMDVARQWVNCEQGRCSMLDTQIPVILARKQLSGRGRGGATWVQAHPQISSSVTLNAPPQGDGHAGRVVAMGDLSEEADVLPLTLVVKGSALKVPLGWVSQLLGCAILDTLAAVHQAVLNTLLAQNQKIPIRPNLDTYLKWPNDIVFKNGSDFKKGAGILCESTFFNGSLDICYLGIGINFFNAPELSSSDSFLAHLTSFSSDSNEKKTKLIQQKNLLEVKSIMLKTFWTQLEKECSTYLFSEKTPAQCRELVLQRSLALGTYLKVNKGLIAGKFLGLSDDGALVLEGKNDLIYSGDVEIIAENKSLIERKNEINKLKFVAKKISKKAVLALDIGNTRVHWMLLLNTKTSGDWVIQNEMVDLKCKENESSFRMLLMQLRNNCVDSLIIKCISVNKSQKIDLCIENQIKQMLPHLMTEIVVFSSVDILEGRGIVSESYPISALGADRALRLRWLNSEALKRGKNVASVTFGTAVTVEKIDLSGSLIDSIIGPGLQFSLTALSKNTGKIPNINISERVEKSWEKSALNTESSLLKSSVLCAYAYIDKALEGASVCWISGGESDWVWDVLKEERRKNCILAERPELDELVNLVKAEPHLVSFPSWSEPLNSDKNQKQKQNDIFREQSRFKKIKKNREYQEKKISDFRRLGGRIENLGVGDRLDSYLAYHFKFHSREVWQGRIIDGEVLVQNTSNRSKQELLIQDLERRIKVTYRLCAGDQIWIFHPLEFEPQLDVNIRICVDDGDTVVIEKPGNLVMHATGMHVHHTFVKALAAQDIQAAAVHRLDKETSGLVLCARSYETRKLLTDLFYTNTMKKFYLAITKGVVPGDSLFGVRDFIGPALGSRIRLKQSVVAPSFSGAQDALTYFQKLGSWQDYTLMACMPFTGRTNQIRIHLSALGMWIVGDKMYHPNEDIFLRYYENGDVDALISDLISNRHMLHNCGLFCEEESAPLIIRSAPLICDCPMDMYDFEPFQKILKAWGVEPQDVPRLISQTFQSMLREIPGCQEFVSSLPRG